MTFAYIHMVYYDNIYYDLRAKSNAQTRVIYQALWLHFQRYLNINQNPVAVQKKKTANNVKQIFQIEIHQFWPCCSFIEPGSDTAEVFSYCNTL